MSILDQWAAGDPCDKHDVPFCSTCKAQAGIRTADADRRYGDVGAGRFSYTGDCAVRTFAVVTGAEAADILLGSGFNPASGTRVDGMNSALTACGFQVRDVTSEIDGIAAAVRLSAMGRRFWVCAATRTKAHAWAIVDGKQLGEWHLRQYRYRVFEVIA